MLKICLKSYLNLVRKAQARGYQVRLVFFWLESSELAIQRVAERVSKGGHNIPSDVIHRRYKAGISNLFNLFMKEVDLWTIYDNSNNKRVFIAKGGKKIADEIYSEKIFNKIKDYVR